MKLTTCIYLWFTTVNCGSRNPKLWEMVLMGPITPAQQQPIYADRYNSNLYPYPPYFSLHFPVTSNCIYVIDNTCGVYGMFAKGYRFIPWMHLLLLIFSGENELCYKEDQIYRLPENTLETQAYFDQDSAKLIEHDARGAYQIKVQIDPDTGSICILIEKFLQTKQINFSFEDDLNCFTLNTEANRFYMVSIKEGLCIVSASIEDLVELPNKLKYLLRAKAAGLYNDITAPGPSDSSDSS